MTPDVKMPSAEEALENLLRGNQRFAGAGPRHPNQTPDRRNALLAGQAPFAAILGCSDSRVPPEVIFDQGLGDLFVIRVAGNTVDEKVLASLEYAAGHLQTPLLVVLGHTRCGAVQAAATGDHLQGHLAGLAESIQPALEKAAERAGDFFLNATEANAMLVAEQLRASKPVLHERVESGKLKIIAACYEMESGVVGILSGVPANY